MVTVEDFKYVLTLWESHKIPDLIEREIKIDLEPNKIIAIAGSRRSGKTYVMFQCMNDLLRSLEQKAHDLSRGMNPNLYISQWH